MCGGRFLLYSHYKQIVDISRIEPTSGCACEEVPGFEALILFPSFLDNFFLAG
jgi:hypothetical protein